jgi:hypothetical protein
MSTSTDDCDPFEYKDPQFHHEMLAAMIMFGEAKMGNNVSYESASKVSLALMREDEHLPLEELRQKEMA